MPHKYEISKWTCLSLSICVLIIALYSVEYIVKSPTDSKQPSEIIMNIATETTISHPAVLPGNFSATSTQLQKVELDVPFVPEAPDGNWTGPWKDACEESSMTMVQAYYEGEKTVSVSEAKKYMQMLFDVQNTLYHSNMNSSSSHLLRLIDEHSSFNGSVKEHPTIEDIKYELDQGRPVISMHRGALLKNKNVVFLSSGSSYHVLVIIGYDDKTQEFITNDPGDRTEGKAHRYGYELFMNSLHDYNYANYQADGPARVILTSPR